MSVPQKGPVDQFEHHLPRGLIPVCPLDRYLPPTTLTRNAEVFATPGTAPSRRYNYYLQRLTCRQPLSILTLGLIGVGRFIFCLHYSLFACCCSSCPSISRRQARVRHLTSEHVTHTHKEGHNESSLGSWPEFFKECGGGIEVIFFDQRLISFVPRHSATLS